MIDCLYFQVWCETNLRRCISKFHRFVCDSCDKAFPLRSALDLHNATTHPDAASDDTQEPEEEVQAGAAETSVDVKPVLPPEQTSFLEGLGLQHISKVSWGMNCMSNQIKMEAEKGSV